MKPLRYWRLVFERTLREVEAATGIPISRLSLLERGLATPSAEDLQRIADAIGLTGSARDLFLLEVARSLNGVGANHHVQPMDTPAVR